MFHPASPEALAISNVFILTLIIAGVIFLLVTGLVLYIAFRYRHKDGQAEPRANFGLTKLEIGWTVGPTVLLAVLFIFTIDSMGQADPAVGQGRQPDIIVTGHQWWWEIQYPTLGITTANEIHLPTGRAMLTRVESDDVIHDLWIPQIARKIDMLPGQPNNVWLQASAPGIYLGACAEYCGTQHAKMLVRAIAQPQAEFDAWAKAQSRPAPHLTTGATEVRGQQLFQQKTCISCHAINGAAANAQVGPDLTHIASRQTLAAGVLLNTPPNLAAWIRNPQQIKPGSHMPNLHLTDDEVNALVAYMETLK